MASPMARLQQKKQAAVTTGLARSTGIPCAMVLTAYTSSPRCPGLIATVTRGFTRKLDPSVGGPGPHAFAVRLDHASPCAPGRPSHPDPTSVATRTPLYRERMAHPTTDLRFGKREIFLRKGIDRTSENQPVGQITSSEITVLRDFLAPDGIGASATPTRRCAGSFAERAGSASGSRDALPLERCLRHHGCADLADHGVAASIGR